MTADFLRDETEAANIFGIRRARLLGSTNDERPDNAQGRRVQAFSFAMHITLITLLIVPALSTFVIHSSQYHTVNRWVHCLVVEQKERFLVAAFLGMTSSLLFSASCLAMP